MAKPPAMRRLILLGAGASAEAGIPTAAKMTAGILAKLDNSTDSVRIRHAVRVAVSTVMFGQGLRGEDPTGGVNIEEVFNILDTLAKRHQLEAAPLIGSWNPIVEKLDVVTTGGKVRRTSVGGTVSSFEARDNARRIAEALSGVAHAPGSWSDGKLADALERVLNPRGSFRSQPPVAEPYRDVPAQGRFFEQAQVFLRDQLKEFVWKRDDAALDYLHALVESAGQDTPPTPIVTLNYDNCIERVAKSIGVQLDTFINEWRDWKDFGFGSYEGIPYLKLHGSITWAKSEAEARERRTMKRVVFSECSDVEIAKEDFVPAVIFGGRNKLTAEGPFLDLLLRFRDELRRTTEVVVVGYSFADGHVNELIAQWFNENEAGRVTVINGENFRAKANVFALELLEHADRVIDLGKDAGAGIAEFFGNTVRE